MFDVPDKLDTPTIRLYNHPKNQ